MTDRFGLGFGLGVLAGISGALIFQLYVIKVVGISHESAVKPEINVKCINQKCDTTYTYKFE